ncbi:SRF-TF domain containing protein [Trichuris trichiura]|uniref:Serum response factor homolog n=1 Tax=Trichuris trichiura TaxID=36087 RepID=A0A077Z7E8_TRITR|nr:SRF-TF domain containing protein [Trichuris trichiura]
MSTTTADHFAEMVPGESFFSLSFPSQEEGAAQPPCESQQTSCMDSDDTATNKEDDEEDESTEMGASLSPSSVHIVNPESPDDDAYAGQQCIESTAPMDHQGATAALSGIGDDGSPSKGRPLLPNGKKTKGRVKIKMEFIDNKLRRYTTFSKRKTGIMKKAYELSTLTGTQVMLLVASETGHVYTFATKKLQPMITSEAGKALIQTCLNSTDGATPSRAPELGMTESSLSGAEAALFTSAPASSKCNGRGGNGSGSTTHPRRTKLGGLSRTPGKVNYHRGLPQGGLKLIKLTVRD